MISMEQSEGCLPFLIVVKSKHYNGMLSLIIIVIMANSLLISWTYVQSHVN